MPARNGRGHVSRAGRLRKITVTFDRSPADAGWEFRFGLERAGALNAGEEHRPCAADAVSAFLDGKSSGLGRHPFSGRRNAPRLSLPISQDFRQEADVPLDAVALSAVPADKQKAMSNFWNSLSTNQKRAFKVKAFKRVFPAGARLMREGDKGDHVAVILSGLTEIRVRENGAERVVAERGPGQLIGERAALEMNPRSATVVAMDTVVALVMRTVDFAAFISTYPSVLKIVENQIYMRLREGAARPERDPRYVLAEDRRDPAGRAASYGAEDGPAWPQLLNGQNCTVVRTDVVAFAAPGRSDEDRKIIREAILASTRRTLGPVWDIVRPGRLSDRPGPPGRSAGPPGRSAGQDGQRQLVISGASSPS